MSVSEIIHHFLALMMNSGKIFETSLDGSISYVQLCLKITFLTVAILCAFIFTRVINFSLDETAFEMSLLHFKHEEPSKT